MKVCVFGLWHLGSVTAACLASKGLEVVAYDPDPGVIARLAEGKAPLFEPGLDALVLSGIKAGKLRFTSSAAEAIGGSDIVWVTIDTPINEDDRADTGWVKLQIEGIFEFIKSPQAMVISSQLAVGSCRELEETYASRFPGRRLPICYSPENLRLGKALDVFQNPDRIVAGIREFKDRSLFEPLFSVLSSKIEWMKTESAEMTKHAINAFLAVSVTFANELAVLCESAGADAREVSRGMLTESRIGPGAYLKAGSAFAGGTLARDVRFLTGISEVFKTPAHILHAILQSNEHHKEWVRRKLEERFKTFKGRKIAVLGLTYKPGTDTLRRSWAVELCRWLKKEGAGVQGFDWQLQQLPPDLASTISLKADCKTALQGCDSVVIGTEHSGVKTITAAEIQTLRRPFIVDPAGTMDRSFIDSLSPLDYCSVGFSLKRGNVS